jgi:hypothetical protein
MQAEIKPEPSEDERAAILAALALEQAESAENGVEILIEDP